MSAAHSSLIVGQGELFNSAGVRRPVAYTIRLKHLSGTMQKFGEMPVANLAGLDILNDRTLRLKLQDGRVVPVEIITQRHDAVFFGIKAPSF